MSQLPSSFDAVKSIMAKSFTCANDNLAPFASFVIFTFGGLLMFILFLLPMLFSYLNISMVQYSNLSLVLNILMLTFFIAIISLLATLTAFKAKSLYSGKYLRTEEAMSLSRSKLLSMMGLTILLLIFISLGLMLFIVPGILLITLLFLTFPVRTFEESSILKTFQRCFEITFANLATIVAVIVIPAICLSIFLLLGLLVMAYSQMYGWILIAAMVGYFLIFSFVSYSVTYLELTKTPENIDAELTQN